MSELTIQIARILLIGTLFAIPGELFDRWLANNGYVRRLAGWPTVLAIGAMIMKEFWFHNVSWLSYSILVILGLVFGLHRGDFWTTWRKGKWWWRTR